MKELTELINQNKPDKPRVRRRSMENMQLLSLTPDKAAVGTSRNKSNRPSNLFYSTEVKFYNKASGSNVKKITISVFYGAL